MSRSWRVAAALTLAALTLRCSVVVDSGGLSGDEADGAIDAPSAEAGPSGNDAQAVGETSDTTDADTTGDAPVAMDAADATGDADAGRDAASIPDGAYVWAGNGHGYIVVTHDGGIGWDVAKQEAIAIGGHLATIGSAAENQFVSAMANTYDRAWDMSGGPYLGGSQSVGAVEPDGGWSWVTGEPWTYSDWSSGEPSGGFQEDFLQIYVRFSTNWNDIPSGASNSFVVEFE